MSDTNSAGSHPAAPARSRPENADDEGGLLDFAGVILRRKRLVICVTAAFAAAALLFSAGSLLLPSGKSYLPNVYSPRSILLFSSSSGGLSSLLGDAAGLAALAGINLGSASGTSGDLAILLLESASTIDELNAEFDFTTRYGIKGSVKADTRTAVKKHMGAGVDVKTRTVTVTFSDIDPEFAYRVVTRAVEILDRRFAAIGGDKALTQKILLETKLADVQAQVKTLEGRINAFTAKYGVLNVEAMATEQVTVLARLRSELIMKDMEIESYQKFSKIDDPVIRRLRSERDSLSAKIADIEKGGGGLPSQRDIPKLAFEYAGLQRDYLVQMEILKLLTQQYELAKMSAEGQEPAFQVLEPAEIPDKKSGPSRGTICMVATMAGFFLAILAAVALDGIEKIRRDPVAMKKLRGGA